MRNHLLQSAEEAMEWNGITFYVVTMTPTLAQELLRGNVKNRSLREAISNNYLTDMRDGSWMFTGDPIRIAPDGTLLDGQHRLTAAAAMPNNWSTPMLVIDGLSKDTQLVMDQGRKRSAGQQLQLLGYKDAAMVAAVATRLIMWHERGSMSRTAERTITTAEVQAYVVANPAVPLLVADNMTSLRATLMTPSVVGAFLVLTSQIDHAEAVNFVDRLADGVELKRGSPILALRERNIRNKADRRTDSDRSQLGLLIKAWNAHLDGKQISKMSMPHGGAFTDDNFPTIKKCGSVRLRAVQTGVAS